VDYAALLLAIRRAFPNTELELVPEEQVKAVREQFPGVPESYLNFLRHVGAGRIGSMGLAVYNGLCEAGEIFDPVDAAELSGVLFFGDDFGGWHIGFDPRAGWQVVSVSSTSPELVPETVGSIGQFVAQWVAERCSA
jgi:hypothetical protein